jgi:hypothetical protein
MSRGRVLAVMLIVVVAVAAVGSGLFFRYRESHIGGKAVAARNVGGAVPAGAQSVVRLLFSPKGRRALTPELKAALRPGQRGMFPAGSRFVISAGGWHRSGAYANVTGTLWQPGKARVRAEVGLVDRHGRWLVTFEETL